MIDIAFDVEELDVENMPFSSIKPGEAKIINQKLVVLTLQDMDNIIAVLEMWENGNMQK